METNNIQTLREVLKAQGGTFQFKQYKDCPAIDVDFHGEEMRMRVLELSLDEDVILIRVDDFTEEIYETIWPDDVLGNGLQTITEAILRII